MLKTSLKMGKDAWILLIGGINSDICTEAKLESVCFIKASMDNIQEGTGTAALNSCSITWWQHVANMPITETKRSWALVKETPSNGDRSQSFWVSWRLMERDKWPLANIKATQVTHVWLFKSFILKYVWELWPQPVDPGDPCVKA